MVNTSTDDVSGAKKCVPVLEDYYECLHHKKEVSLDSPALLSLGQSECLELPIDANRIVSQAARTRALQHAYRRAMTQHPRENEPRVGTIRNLGLLDHEEDTKSVLESK